MSAPKTVTFLVTDIEGSTPLWEQYPESMKRALSQHDHLLRQAITANKGTIFKTAGDAFYSTFGTATDALSAAVSAQRALLATQWAETPLKVRMALHTGVAEERDDDFFGADVNRVIRLLSAGRGGQVLLTGSVRQLVRDRLPEDLQLRPLGLYRFKGLASPERIYQVIGSGLPADTLPLAIEGTPFNNLPGEMTAFIGRQRELADLDRLLDDPAVRLVTILGQGGLGKTRLALEVARSRVTGYGNGVVFVSLVGATTEQAMVNAMAGAFGFQLRAGASQSQQILDFLHEKELLLLLDNFDLALDHTEFLSRILQSAPDVTILATSREKLGLQEEQLYGIGGLDYIQSGREADMLSLDALQLFLQGSRRVKPDFEPEPDDVTHVTRICRLVGGSPLAILLAAAWIELLRPQEIGDEIERSLDILSTDLRNVPERQRSIRAVIESSWRQLGEPERAIFVELSTFHGGFTLEAAQAVTSASLRQLMLISNKSLIWRDRSGRFQIHQLPLQFAHEKLAAEPDLERQARMRHSQYYAELLVELGREQPASEFAQSMNEVVLELHNVRAGWHWAAEWGTLEQIRGYSAGLRRFFEDRGWYLGGADDVAHYELALARVEATPSEVNQRRQAFCQLHEILGDIAMLSGQYDHTKQHYDKALAQLTHSENLWMARLYRKKANALRSQTQFESAIEAYAGAAEALELNQYTNQAWWREWIQIQLELVWLNYWRGNSDDVRTLNDEVRPKVEQYGTLGQQVNFFIALAAMGYQRDGYLNTRDSAAFTQIAYERSLDSGNPHDIAWSEFTHGFSLLWCAEYEQADELMQAALSLARENGDFVHQARCATYLTILHRKQGDPKLVKHFAQLSLKLARKANMLEYIGTAYANQAWLAWFSGNLEESVTFANKALQKWHSLDQPHASVTFKWTAMWPLIAVALCEDRIGDAVAYAGQMLEPGQQRLPGQLYQVLKEAGQSWAREDRVKCRACLISAVAQSDLCPPLTDVIGEIEQDAQRSVQLAGAYISLTPRESEVLRLIAAGYSNHEIAEQLVVEVSTVKKHINHLFAKLDVDSRTRALVRARELDLL